jgi:hypothetical protein
LAFLSYKGSVFYIVLIYARCENKEPDTRRHAPGGLNKKAHRAEKEASGKFFIVLNLRVKAGCRCPASPSRFGVAFRPFSHRSLASQR